MNRETKKIKLPLTGKEVVIYTFITGGEKRQINEILVGDTASFEAGTGQVKGDIPLSKVYEANNKAVELLIVSIDEKTEDVTKILNDLPSKDYDFVYNEINEITGDKDFLDKAKN